MKLLKTALVTLSLFALAGTAHARSEPFETQPEYMCQTDTDCVTARAPCGEIRAVNRNHHDQIQAEWNRMAALVECAGLGVVPEDVPSCSPDKTCVMIAPTHPIQPNGEPHAQ